METLRGLRAQRIPNGGDVEGSVRVGLRHADVSTCWACVGISSAAREPVLYALVAEDVLAGEGDGLMFCTEGFCADVACLGWVELGVEKVLHSCYLVETWWLSRKRVTKQIDADNLE
jgi:hypothetical protein